MRFQACILGIVGAVAWPIPTEAEYAPLYSVQNGGAQTARGQTPLRDRCAAEPSRVKRTATVSVVEATIRFGPGASGSLAADYSVTIDGIDRHVANCHAQGTTRRTYAVVAAEVSFDQVAVRFVNQDVPGDIVVMTGSIDGNRVNAHYVFCAAHDPCSTLVTVPLLLNRMDPNIPEPPDRPEAPGS